MGQIKKLYQDSGNVETIVSTETNAVYPITASSAVYHESAWGTGGTGQSVSSILAALNQGYLYVGLATPSTNPGSYNHKVFYIAGESGTYTNFGGIEVSGLTILKSDGNGWTADSVGISGGGGGSTSGGYIGKTAVQSNSAAQALTGITSLSLEGNAQRIYFGDSSHYLEWDADNSAFHFSHGVYSSSFVSAAGVGSGGGGGTGDKALKDLTDVNNSLSPAAKNVLWYDSTASKWDAHALTYTDITDFPALGTSSGFLKYTYSGGSGSWSLANGTVTLTNVMGQATGRTRIVTIDGTDVYAPSSGSTSIANLTSIGDVEDVNYNNDGKCLTYHHTSNGGYWAADTTPGGGSGTDTWRGIQVNGLTFKSNATTSGVMNFEAGTNVSLTTSGNTITIAASGGGGGSTVSWGTTSSNTSPLTVNGTSKTVLLSGWTPDLSGYMDLTTNQTVTSGLKTFVEGVGLYNSSHTLKYNNSNSRFEFNGNLYVTGNIIATGAVTAGA